MDQYRICLLEIWDWLSKCFLKINISKINLLNIILKIPSSPKFCISLIGLFTSQFAEAKTLPSHIPHVDLTLTSPAGHVSSLPTTSLPPP